MSIVKHLNKKTGVTYVYESKSYWDPELKAPRSHRTLIGKIMPGTEEIIPTGKKGGTREKMTVEEKEAAWKAKKAEEELKKAEEKALGLENADYKQMLEDARRNYAIQESYRNNRISEVRQMVEDQQKLIVTLNVQLTELTSKMKKTMLILDELMADVGSDSFNKE